MKFLDVLAIIDLKLARLERENGWTAKDCEVVIGSWNDAQICAELQDSPILGWRRKANDTSIKPYVGNYGATMHESTFCGMPVRVDGATPRLVTVRPTLAALKARRHA